MARAAEVSVSGKDRPRAPAVVDRPERKVAV
jgi:hypothetical protein